MVDDILAVRMVLAQLLERMGHHVRSVESGSQALTSLNEYRPDVIFSDISMPVMDGYEFVRRLRQRPDTRLLFIIAMTASGDTCSEQASVLAGFNVHLNKPFDVEAIRRLMNDSRIGKATGEFLDS